MLRNFLLVAALFAVQCMLTRGLLEMANTAWSGQKPRLNALFNFKVGLKAAAAGFRVTLSMSCVWLFASILGGGPVLLLSKLKNTTGETSPLEALFMLLATGLVFLAFLFFRYSPQLLVLLPLAEKPELRVKEAFRLCQDRGRSYRWKILLMGGLLAAFVFISGVFLGGFLDTRKSPWVF